MADSGDYLHLVCLPTGAESVCPAQSPQPLLSELLQDLRLLLAGAPGSTELAPVWFQGLEMITATKAG